MKDKRKILTLLIILLGVTTTVFAQEGFGITKPTASAAVEVASTTKGFLLPRMTDAQMAAIVSPVEGLMVFNTTRHSMMYYSSGAWICASIPSLAQLPVASAVSVSGNLWGGSVLTASYTYSEATGIAAGTPIYQWYSSSTGVNGSQVALPGGTVNPYTNSLGVRMYVAVGVTPVTSTGVRGTEVMSPWYRLACPSTLTGYHDTNKGAPVYRTITYNVVLTTLAGTGPKCWITQNLGADQEATSDIDASAASSGWYWEFNRAQGFVCNGATYTPSAWVTATLEMLNWSLDKDPCALLLGAGWRLPTVGELNSVITNGGSTSANLYASGLKLHNAGYVTQSTGLSGRGAQGYYWTSSQNDATNGNCLTACYLSMSTTGAAKQFLAKDVGCTVRCLKD